VWHGAGRRDLRGEGYHLLTVPNTLKNRLGNSSAMVAVETANTPRGKVKPHQPWILVSFLAL
jgi:hypothetical protein